MRNLRKSFAEIFDRYAFSVSLICFLLLFYPFQVVFGLKNDLAFAFSPFLDGEYFRALTYPLAHKDLFHLAGNVLGLAIIGHKVESKLNWKNLVVLFAFSSELVVFCVMILEIVFFNRAPVLGLSAFVYFLFGIVLVQNFREELLPENLSSRISEIIRRRFAKGEFPRSSFDEFVLKYFKTINSVAFWALATLLAGWIGSPGSGTILGHSVGFVIGILVGRLISLKTVRENVLFG